MRFAEAPTAAGVEGGPQGGQAGLAARNGRSHDLEVLELAASEQFVVDGVQGVEVLVFGVLQLQSQDLNPSLVSTDLITDVVSHPAWQALPPEAYTQ